MATVDASAGAPAADGTLDLVDAACREHLRKLTKEGGVSEFSSQIAGALGFTIAAIVAIVYIRLDVYNSTTISTGIRGWARLAYWVLLFSVPFCLAFAGWAFVMSKRVAASANLMLTCPGCGTTHEISDVHGKSFRINCPRCYAVIVGSADAYSLSRHCDYCGLVYFGAAGGGCPSCRGGNTMAACPHCKAAIPHGAIGCVSCNRWLLAQETGYAGSTYDPIAFGPKLARAYIVGIWESVSSVADDLDRILQSVPNPRDFPPATAGSVSAALNTPGAVLPKLALAAQWLQRPGVPPEPLPSTIAEGLARLDASVARCVDGGMKHLLDVQAAVRTARRTVA